MNRAIAGLLLCFLFNSCQSPQESPSTTVFSGTAMTIDYKIIIGQHIGPHKKHMLETLIYQTLDEIDRVYNKWNPESELSQLNTLGAYQVVSISQEMERFLHFTQQIVKLSEGRFDPTIEPLQALWKSHLIEGISPSKEAIAELIPTVGWDKIHFENGRFFKEHEKCSLDLGGIAKGYCVDLMVERLLQAGFPNTYVEWGGEIRTHGQHPTNRPWKICISNLGDDNPENAIATLSLCDEAIATSGDYLQNWTVDGTTYCHVIDPKTFQPLKIHSNSIASTSVIAPNCALADGLATAAMLFPTVELASDWAVSIQKEYPNTQFWIIKRE